MDSRADRVAKVKNYPLNLNVYCGLIPLMNHCLDPVTCDGSSGMPLGGMGYAALDAVPKSQT